MTPDREAAAKKLMRYGSEVPNPTGARCSNCTKVIRDEDAPAGFCSMDCMRAKGGEVSQSKLRDLVFQRDRGKCAGVLRNGQKCPNDCEELAGLLDSIQAAGRARYDAFVHTLVRAGFDRDAIESKGSLWEADHVNPRVKGGPTTLENARTLCLACHHDATRLLNQERSGARKRARFGR